MIEGLYNLQVLPYIYKSQRCTSLKNKIQKRKVLNGSKLILNDQVGHFKTIQNLQRFPILPFLHTCVEYSVNFFCYKSVSNEECQAKKVGLFKYSDVQTLRPSIRISKSLDILVY